MKKTNLKSAFLILALSIGAGSFLVGCSNSEDLSNELTPKEGMGIVSFSIDEKDYETSGNVTSTRAAAQSQPEIQDLGDGWQAEVSLVPDTTRRPEQKLHVLFTETSIIPSVLTKVLHLKEKSKVRLMVLTLHQTLEILE